MSLQVLNNKQMSFQTMVFLGAKQYSVFISDKITNVAVFSYGAWFWLGQIHYSGHSKGWALKISTCLVPIALNLLVAISGPRKVLIF